MIKCLFHHNPSPDRSSNWCDSTREPIPWFLSVWASYSYPQWEISFSKLHFLGWAISLNQGLCVSFQLKSPMCCHETGRTAHVSGIQDANMSPERVVRRFTLFVAVLSLFLSQFGADLDHSWNACRNLSPQIKKIIFCLHQLNQST